MNVNDNYVYTSKRIFIFIAYLHERFWISMLFSKLIYVQYIFVIVQILVLNTTIQSTICQVTQEKNVFNCIIIIIVV